MLKAGDKAPEFTLKDDGGRDVSLSDFKGKTVVLYFYPKDDTPGCTKEACDFRDSHRRFQARGAAVLGVSRDPASSHARFKKKHGLPFPLLSDEDGRACRAYGVWVRKSLYGRTYMGVERSTFVIDGRGVIVDAARKVKVDGHAGATLEKVGGAG